MTKSKYFAIKYNKNIQEKKINRLDLGKINNVRIIKGKTKNIIEEIEKECNFSIEE